MKLAKIAGLFLLIATAGCTQRMLDFTVLSTKNQIATEGYVKGPRVTGSDCVAVVFIPLGNPSIKAAIDNTIELAGPGFDALVDGVVNSHNKSFFFGSLCVEVTGTPINTHSKKTAEIFPSGRVWKHGSEVASAENLNGR